MLIVRGGESSCLWILTYEEITSFELREVNVYTVLVIKFLEFRSKLVEFGNLDSEWVAAIK
jgi:hypothetical protein